MSWLRLTCVNPIVSCRIAFVIALAGGTAGELAGSRQRSFDLLTIALSKNAVVELRFRVKGWKMPVNQWRLNQGNDPL